MKIFRAWDGNKMLEPIGVEKMMFSPGQNYDHMPWYPTLGDHKGTTAKIMQYTGLKDKNGVEIYEGDVVETTWIFKSIGVKQSKAVVSFKNACFGLLWNNPKHADDEGFHPLWSREEHRFMYIGHMNVIGNIYENPELLDDSQ